MDVPRTALKRLKTAERSQLTVREDFDQIFLDGGPIRTRRHKSSPEALVDLSQRARGKPSLFLIQCVGPVQEDWVKRMDELKGARRVSYLAQNAYLLWATPEAAERIRQEFPFVQWDGPFLARHKLHPRLGRRAGRDLDVTLVLVDHPEVETSMAHLKRLAKKTIRPERRRLGQVAVSVTLQDSHLDELARLPDVIGIEPYVEPKRVDEAQGQITAGNLTASGAGPSGAGYLAALAVLGFPADPALYPIVDVTDDGFDTGSATAPGHPDFYRLGQTANPSRVVYAVDRTPDGNPHGVGGHGTINAAIVGGYNDTSGFPFEDAGGFQLGLGLAPHGRLASSKIFRDSGPFGLIGSFTDLISGSYALGARISTNSWGAGSTFSWTPGFNQAGSYPNVHFEATDGPLSDSEEITLTVNNAPQPSSVSGIVTSTAGQPLAGVSMTLSKLNVKPSFKRTTKTDSSGGYRFPNLTSGSYNLSTSKSGYRSQKVGVNLGEEEDKVVNFALQPK